MSLFPPVPEATGQRPPVPQLAAQRGKSPRKHWMMDAMGAHSPRGAAGERGSGTRPQAGDPPALGALTPASKEK